MSDIRRVPATEIKSWRDKLLNRYTIALGGIISLLALKFGLDRDQQGQVQNKIKAELLADPNIELPEDMKEAEVVLKDMAEEAVNALMIKKAKEEQEGVQNSIDGNNLQRDMGVVRDPSLKDDVEDEPPEGLEGQALKDYYIKLHGPISRTQKMGDNIAYYHDDGFSWGEPLNDDPEPTVNEENIVNIREDFERYLPKARISIENSNNIYISVHAEGIPEEVPITVEVLEDGTYNWGGIHPYHEGGFYSDTASLTHAIEIMLQKYREQVERHNQLEQSDDLDN